MLVEPASARALRCRRDQRPSPLADRAKLFALLIAHAVFKGTKSAKDASRLPRSKKSWLTELSSKLLVCLK
jgi:hypothetical protein